MIERNIPDVHTVRRQPDRCPYPRPFPPGFSGCPAYEPRSFVAADSRNVTLGTWLTCRHLTVGTEDSERGTFYPRCSLGDADRRLHWVNQVSPGRLHVLRSIEEEFEAFAAARKADLFAAKAAALEEGSGGPAQRRLERLMNEFLADAADFLAGREGRFRDLGIPIQDVLALTRDVAGTWVHSRRLDMLELPTPKSAPEPERERRDETMIFVDGGATLARIADDPVAFVLRGEIDADNAAAIERALASALPSTGDVTIDVSGLVFADLGGLRSLVRVRSQLGPDRRMVLAGAPRHVRRALNAAGWLGRPNLVLADADHDLSGGETR
jgi:anti-anti-sigma regulatory factor